MPTLAENSYGKSRVRLLKLTRTAARHTVRDWIVHVFLTGDFAPIFTDGDNTGVLATDTMKNTVYSVARTSHAETMEAFALELAAFLSTRNPQAATIRIEVEEKTWKHIKAPLAEHPSAFLHRGPELQTTDILLPRNGPPSVTSGVSGLAILKTAHSAFHGFQRDELTTLPETGDRLLGTEATITWLYAAPPTHPSASRRTILDALLATFATHESLSVQHTLYAMAAAALAAAPEISEITLTMPNRHNLLVDFSRFAAPFNGHNANEIFIPTEEPSGVIHARITR